MEFNNRVITTVDVGEFTVWITETHVSTWAVMAILIALALVVRIALKSFTEVPAGKQNVIELLVEGFDNFVQSTMGKENRGFGKWYFGIFLFILAGNFSGLINLRPPTADVSTTLALSISTFVIVQMSACLRSPKKYAKSFFEPFIVFFPLNVIGDLAIIISLAFRLFGNILSGVIVLGLVYYALPPVISLAVPVPLHAYFDIFAGTIQAFIFTVLSLIFIKNKLPA